MSHFVGRSGVEFFESKMSGHNAVKSCAEISPQFYKIEREMGDTLYVYLTGVYVLGEIDYHELRRGYPLLTTIVLAGPWQNIGFEPKDEAADSEIGIFKVKGFMGSLNRRDHWNYDGPAIND